MISEKKKKTRSIVDLSYHTYYKLIQQMNRLCIIFFNTSNLDQKSKLQFNLIFIIKIKYTHIVLIIKIK